MEKPIVFGQYLLLECTNLGGMAEIYKAKAFGVEGFQRILCIKKILPRLAEDNEFIDMFLDEARILVQLHHANIVQVYELGKFEDQYYIAMEYINGKNIRELIKDANTRNERLPLPLIAFIMSKVCEGLEYAHNKKNSSGQLINCIHRDVSPQNILIGFDGAVKVGDFGIAKAENRVSKTQVGVLKGKFSYMSPEQVSGSDIDHRSDIFSTGILLYEISMGKRLFKGKSDFDILESVRYAKIPSLIKQDPNIPKEFEEIVFKSLAQNPNNRYQHISELYNDLQQFLISEKSIFSTRNLAFWMQAKYKDTIDKEMKKMNRYESLKIPSNLLKQLQNKSKKIKTIDHKTQETGIFESDIINVDSLTDAVTLVKEKPAQDSIRSSLKNMSRKIKISELSSIKSKIQRKGRFHITLIMMSLLFLLLFILGIGWFLNQNNTQVIVTSSPITKVNVYLNNQLITQKTPYVIENINVGVLYKVKVRADGYMDYIQEFELVKAGQGKIHFDLKPLEKEVKKIKLFVNTLPKGARVKISGKLRGQTPLVIEDIDPQKSYTINISKENYEKVKEEVIFSISEIKTKSKKIEYILNPIQKENIEKKSSVINKREDKSPVKQIKLKKRNKKQKQKQKQQKLQKASLECKGIGGKLSAIDKDNGGCLVKIGKKKIGITPFFKKRIPLGMCNFYIKCENGKIFKTKKLLKKENKKIFIWKDRVEFK